jgi:hypothetical protein
MSNKARDASPIRTHQLSFEEKCLRVGCSKQHQWVLLFCGTLLECDVPILEALFWTTMAYLGPRSNDTLKAIFCKMEVAIRGYVRQIVPMTPYSERLYASPTHHTSIDILSRAGKCIEIKCCSYNRRPDCGLVPCVQKYTISFVDREYLTIYGPADGRISIRSGQFNATLKGLIQSALDISSAREEPLIG